MSVLESLKRPSCLPLSLVIIRKPGASTIAGSERAFVDGDEYEANKVPRRLSADDSVFAESFSAAVLARTVGSTRVESTGGTTIMLTSSSS